MVYGRGFRRGDPTRQGDQGNKCYDCLSHLGNIDGKDNEMLRIRLGWTTRAAMTGLSQPAMTGLQGAEGGKSLGAD